jgi:hypothetical protein
VLVSLAIGTIDGPLPLHFAEQLGQAEIAALYVLAAVVVAAGSAASGRVSPGNALWAGGVLSPLGIAVVGITGSVPPWVVGMIVAGAGFGLAEAGALGFLLETVERERILTAWVIWSQLWAVGYLAGPPRRRARRGGVGLRRSRCRAACRLAARRVDDAQRKPGSDPE